MTTNPTHMIAAGRAAMMLRAMPPTRRAMMLRELALALVGARARVLGAASRETGLTLAELAPEFDRTTGTLAMFADLVAEGSWVRAAIDTGGGGAIGPSHDVRRMLIPLDGPVLVLGASNFPLAYGVLGGDTASALAAGCSVIVKEHPAHPRTGRLLARLAAAVLRRFVPGPARALVYVPLPRRDDLSIVPGLVAAACAIGLTGSAEAGAALDALARARRDASGLPAPIPLFAEMGSVNRVLVARGALRARAEQIAAELAASIVARHGQQCTKPGLIFVDGDGTEARAFIARLAELLDAAPARRMLSPNVARRYAEGCTSLATAGLRRLTARVLTKFDGEKPDAVTAPALFAAGSSARAVAAISREVFGPCAVVAGPALLGDARLELPSLAACIYAQRADLRRLLADGTLSRWQSKTGRLVINGVPTGVRVATAMVHAGPFPATNRPEASAVGPSAIERWCRPVCFQNAPAGALPPELRDENPLGIERVLDGRPTRGPVTSLGARPSAALRPSARRQARAAGARLPRGARRPGGSPGRRGGRRPR